MTERTRIAERDIQRAVLLHWKVRRYPHTRIAAIRNESASFANKGMLNAALAEGLTPGMPDLIVLGPEREQVRFIELKAADGVLSNEQKRIHAEMTELGLNVRTAWSLDEALSILVGWGVIRAEATPAGSGGGTGRAGS